MKLGLVCISEILKQRDKKLAFQTMTRKQFNKLGRDNALPILSKRILHNCRLTRRIVEHCKQSGIAHYRLSSNLFPLVTDTSLNICCEDLPDFDDIIDSLIKIDFNDLSISCHPDQFNVLPSLNPHVVDRTIHELNHQSWVMDQIGLPQNLDAPMCLHVSLSPKQNEDICDFLNRFYYAFDRCDLGVRKRLVLENEDKGHWNCKNLYATFSDYFALVYDNLHDKCNKSYPDVDYCRFFSSTWGAYTPVFHWSEGDEHKVRSHIDYFSHIPNCVKDNPEIIWECEVKAKDLAIMEAFLLDELSKKHNIEP